MFWILLILLPSLSLAAPFFEEHARGWHWYDDPEAIIETERAIQNQGDISATQTMQKIKKKLEESLSIAILSPTQENVKQYIVLQNALSKQSTQFSNVWQQILRVYPELNFNLTHPTNQLSRQLYLSEKASKQRETIKRFMADKGLFFFYRTECPYCQKFSPILKVFAKQLDINVIPISLDSHHLPEFPETQIDTGQAKRFEVTVTPAVFLVNPYTEKAMPVSAGLVSMETLESRLAEMIQTIDIEVQGGF